MSQIASQSQEGHCWTSTPAHRSLTSAGDPCPLGHHHPFLQTRRLRLREATSGPSNHSPGAAGKGTGMLGGRLAAPRPRNAASDKHALRGLGEQGAAPVGAWACRRPCGERFPCLLRLLEGSQRAGASWLCAGGPGTQSGALRKAGTSCSLTRRPTGRRPAAEVHCKHVKRRRGTGAFGK